MLNVLSREEAVSLIKEKTAQLKYKTEKLNIRDCVGRVLAEDIVSVENVPSFNRSTVDGYAVCAADTFGAGDSVPSQLEITGEILMGESADFRLKRGQCVKISTGGMMPAGADAAVMVEHTDCDGSLCLIYKSVAPGENVTLKGDDICEGETALKTGCIISSPQTGVLAALGINELNFFKRPLVTVISTGDEIVNGKPQPGQIRDINSYLLCAALNEYGCNAFDYGSVPDIRESVEKAIKECVVKSDAVIISGGSSAGSRDMTVDIINSLGKAYFHGIAMKPGKPTIFGMIEGKPVFGLPGHPLAAYFVFRLIVTEYIRSVLKMSPEKPAGIGILSENIPSNHGREEFICIKKGENGRLIPVHTKSGIISVLSVSEGFIKIPRDKEGLAAGETAEVYKL